MKTQPLIDLNRAEIELIIDALRIQMRKLSGADQKLLELDFKKVLEKRELVELDGMGMKQISTALRRKALMFTAIYGSGKHVETKRIMCHLAALITKRRITFQEANNPLNKKEASTAGTANAS